MLGFRFGCPVLGSGFRGLGCVRASEDSLFQEVQGIPGGFLQFQGIGFKGC